MDADCQLATHAQATTNSKRINCRNQFPPRNGKLYSHWHACSGLGGSNQLCQFGFLPNDGLARERIDWRCCALPLLARRRQRILNGTPRRRTQRQTNFWWLPGQGQKEKRKHFRCPTLRLAPDRCQWQTNRLDDLHDGHHRAQSRQGAIGGIL